jgi:DNA polymerase V
MFTIQTFFLILRMEITIETGIQRPVQSLYLPYVESGISAGFPSPANDFLDIAIDLNKEYIKHPSATFFARVKGNSMLGAGLNDGDLLIIDRSLEAKNGKIAVCYIDGEFTVKSLKIEKDVCYLMPANEAYKPIRVDSESNFLVWGIVTTVIKKV